MFQTSIKAKINKKVAVRKCKQNKQVSVKNKPRVKLTWGLDERCRWEEKQESTHRLWCLWALREGNGDVMCEKGAAESLVCKDYSLSFYPHEEMFACVCRWGRASAASSAIQKKSKNHCREPSFLWPLFSVLLSTKKAIFQKCQTSEASASFW